MDAIRLAAKLDPARVARVAQQREVVIPLDFGPTYIEAVRYHAQFGGDPRLSVEVTAQSIDGLRNGTQGWIPLLQSSFSVWCRDDSWLDYLETLVVEQGIYPSEQCEQEARTLEELEASHDVRSREPAADPVYDAATNGVDQGGRDDGGDRADSA
jgi:hypothetical protein